MVVDVRIPPGHHIERIYALHVLLDVHLGLRYRVIPDSDAPGYVLSFGSRSCVINDAFFGKYRNRSYLAIDALPQPVVSTQPDLDGIVILHGEDEFADGTELYCGADLVASTFFMLTRWEEYVSGKRDEHGRFPATASLAYQHRFLQRPVVDEYGALLRKLLLRCGIPEHAFTDRNFVKHLSVDVDHAYLWTGMLSVARNIIGRTWRERTLSAGSDAWRAYRDFWRGGKDPYDRLSSLRDIAQNSGSRFSCFFMSGGTHRDDPGQTLHDPRVAAQCRQISRDGAQIGLHPSYLTATDPRMFDREVRSFKEIAGEPVKCGRQHFLRFSVPQTWRLWEDAGALWESSMAYPEQIGFRCGTSHPFPVFDILERRMLYLVERPLLVMDVTLRLYCGFNPEEAIEQCLAIRKQTEKHKGEFVVLWHNSSFYSATWRGYDRVLETIMK